MRKHIKDCQRICEAAGLSVLDVEFRGKHMAIICSEGRVFMPNTPGDFRWRYKARSFARRMASAQVN